MATDVLIVGAGPVGLTVAMLLARLGLRVEVVEKRREPSGEPRAVSLDDEGLRIWQACGLEDLLCEDCVSGEEGQCICTYVDERDRPVLRIHQRTSDLGHPHATAIHQARVEAKLLWAAERHPLIRVHRGWTVRSLVHTDDDVGARCQGPGGEALECLAPWVIGCDGAGSFVRESVGIGMDAMAIGRPWLVANVVDTGSPGHVKIRCRARAATVTMPLPHGVRRIEVELNEGDDGRCLADEAEVRQRLESAWKGAARATIIGATVCTFRAGVAKKWRKGRVFLAGDAAHVMPPFAGQGLGAGLRDAANLTFKLAGVCQGWLRPDVLDTYEIERRPHVERMIRLSCRLGRVMSPRSRLEALAVRTGLRMLGSSSMMAGRWLLRGPNIRPKLSSGFVVPSARAGRYLPQPMVVSHDDRRVRFDALLGLRMTWIVLGGHHGVAVATRAAARSADRHGPDGRKGFPRSRTCTSPPVRGRRDRARAPRSDGLFPFTPFATPRRRKQERRMPTWNNRLTSCARSRLVGVACLAPALGGCVANSSNPVVAVVSATDDDERATFKLDLYNPGGRHLTVTRVDYAVSHGESLFPVSSGSWTGELDLRARAHATLMLETPFDATPIEPDSRLFHLGGELCFTDRTGFLGLKSMDLTRSQFSVEAQADRSAP